MYKAPDRSQWTGRNDEESKGQLWHHRIELWDLNTDSGFGKGVSLLGFESDEGVERNLGRIGAVEGPTSIRQSLGGLVFSGEGKVYDAGNVKVEGKNLESGQAALAKCIERILTDGQFPLLIGGGHEISYGHIKGVLSFLGEGSKVGVINFDPHFDLRAYPNGSHSGSWARQLFDEHQNFNYFPIGINESVNIQSMFDLMREKDQGFITMDELLGESRDELQAKIEWFISSMDKACITLDLDVFSAGIAPGVSALNPYGAHVEHIKPLFQGVMNSGKVISADIAEMNPKYDDGRTSKLAAFFVNLITGLSLQT